MTSEEQHLKQFICCFFLYTAIVLSKTNKFTIFAIQYYTVKEIINLLNNLSCFT